MTAKMIRASELFAKYVNADDCIDLSIGQIADLLGIPEPSQEDWEHSSEEFNRLYKHEVTALCRARGVDISLDENTLMADWQAVASVVLA